MNKKFTLSLLVILIFIIGVPMAFGQGTGSVTITPTRPINSLHTYIKVKGTAQQPNNGVYGLDSTSFTGTIKGRKVGTGGFNIVESALLGDAGFIMFEDNAANLSTAFKFYENDTIYLTLQSYNSPTNDVDKDVKARNRFAFDTTKNKNVGYQITGTGSNSMQFNIPDGIGLTGATDTAWTISSPGKINMKSNDSNKVAIVIKKVGSHLNTAIQLTLTDLYLTTAGRWLQGATQCADTLLVAYGRGDQWTTPGLSVQVPRGGINMLDGGYYPVGNSSDAVMGSSYYTTPDAGVAIGADTLWRMYLASSPATQLLVAGTDDTLWGFKGELDALTRDSLGRATQGLLASGGEFIIGSFKILADSNQLMDDVTIKGRAPVTVRRGTTYWTFDPGEGNHFDNNFTNGAAPGTGEYVGGAPILLLTLLPGDAKFVRWNVGFGGELSPEIRVNDLGKLIPTDRRRHARGKFNDGTGIDNIGDGDEFAGYFTVMDTLTTYFDTDVNGTWTSAPDTLFIFDQDSNIVSDRTTAPVLIGVDSTKWDGGSSGSSYIGDMSLSGRAFGVRKWDTLYEAGRRIFNWGFDISNNQRYDRIRKIRLVAALPQPGKPLPWSNGTDYYRLADTLNSAFAAVLDDDGEATFVSAGEGTGDAATTINVGPGPVASMSVMYKAPGIGQDWQPFVDGGIHISSSQAKDPGHLLRVELRDRNYNIIRNSAVGINIYGSSSYIDTVAIDAKNEGAGRFVQGYNGAYSRPTPTMDDTLFLYARADADIDDRGMIQAKFNTICNNNVIYFAFNAYADSNNSLAFEVPPVGESVTGDNNPPVMPSLGGGPGTGNNTYMISISGSTSAANVFLSNSANGYIRGGGGANVAQIAATSTTQGATCANEPITFQVEAIDDCNHWLEFSDTSQITIYKPVWLCGGWGTEESKKRQLGDNKTVQGSLIAPSGTLGYTWNLAPLERQGKGKDSIGYFLPNANNAGTVYPTKWIEDGKIFFKYVPPDMSKDTVMILVSAKGSALPPDTNVIATLSTQPQNFRLSMRPTGVGDTMLVASRGTTNTSTTTFAYGLLRDCNDELVSDAYSASTKVYWRLEGTSRWSAFLFNPSLVYSAAGHADSLITGVNVDGVPLYFNNNDLTTYRGTRQWVGSINSDQGRAYVGINSDTVGGTHNVSGAHVFPLERGNVFPISAFNSADSVTHLYAWDGEEWWNRQHGLGPNGQDMVLPATTAKNLVSEVNWSTNAAGTGGMTIANNKIRYNLRGYNRLTAKAYFIDSTAFKLGTGDIVVNDLTTAYDTTSTLKYGTGVGTDANAKVARYQVVADAPNQIAWLDGTGEYFDNPSTAGSSQFQLPGLNYLSLYGRQAAKIKAQSTTPYIITTREVINEVNGTTNNSWAGGRSYAGAVVPLYARLYDVYGNPAVIDSPSFSTANINTSIVANVIIEKGVNRVGAYTADTAMVMHEGTNAQTSTNLIWNQFFVGGSNNGNSVAASTTTTSKVGAAARLKTLVDRGKLRGAVRVEYQTLSHAGNITTTTGLGLRNNIKDSQMVVAKLVLSGLTTLADTAAVVSKPTGELAKYTPIGYDLSVGRVGIGNVVNWGAYDSLPDQTPQSVRLLWYDTRLYPSGNNLTKVAVGVDKESEAPLAALYPTLPEGEDEEGFTGIIPLPAYQRFYGWAEISDNTGTTFGDRTYLDGSGATFTDIHTEGKTFEAKQTGKHLGLNGNTTATTSMNQYGFLGGIGRVKYTGVKADSFTYAIVDSTTNGVVGILPSKIKVLPGPIHWIAMGNPDAVFPEKEALHPYPIRKLTNEAVEVQFDNTVTATQRPWNAGSDLGKNPRSYTPPVDTVFVGQIYNLEIRTYDRWGNRNTIDSVYVSLEKPTGFWTSNWGSPGNEVLLDQDVTGKSLEQVCDVLKMIPTEDNFPVGNETAAYKGFADKLRINFNSNTTSMNRSVNYKPDLNEALIVAFRDVYVKKLQKPGTFEIKNPPSLVRLDEDVFFLPTWDSAKSTNLNDDSIKYTVYFKDAITDAELWKTDASISLSQDDDTKYFSYIIPDDVMQKEFKLGPGHYNRSIKWYVEAKNKWGLTTNSDTKTTTFEFNKKPEAFKLKPASKVITTMSEVTLKWECPIDSNGLYDAVSTNPNFGAISSYGKSYQLDTVHYKIVFTKLAQFPEEENDSLAVPAAWETEVILSTEETLTLADLKALVDKADDVTYTWQVFAKDRTTRDWDETAFVTASNLDTIHITKIGVFNRIVVDDVNSSDKPIHIMSVTDSVIFTLTAKDENDNIIRGFDTYNVTLKLEASGVDLIGGFTPRDPRQVITLTVGGKALEGNSIDGFKLPSSYFVNGEVDITYRNTRANEVINIVIPNNNPLYKVVDGENKVVLIYGTSTRDYMSTIGPVATLSVEVKPRKPITSSPIVTVYVMRAMEVVVTPSDIYGNEIIDLKNDILFNMTAAYPDEFKEGLFPGFRPIKGKSSYILTPIAARNDQLIQARLYTDASVVGQSNSFVIATHAPSEFRTDRPANTTLVELNTHAQENFFTWTQSTDPNDKILITTVPLAGEKVVPDTVDDVDHVSYTIKIAENLNFQLAGGFVTTESFRTTGTSLLNLVSSLGYGDANKESVVNWYVEATDGLYTTKSNSSELRIKVMNIIDVKEENFIPETFALGQNYPNPFNPTTNIQYDIAKATDVKIVIYNILGQPVRTLVNARQEAARYSVTWDGKNDHGTTVATGTYIYQIKAGEFSATKKMNLLK